MNCSNCGSRFVAYYSHDEENVDTVEVQKCGLCHGEEFRRDNFKGATIRLLVQAAELDSFFLPKDRATVRVQRVYF